MGAEIRENKGIYILNTEINHCNSTHRGMFVNRVVDATYLIIGTCHITLFVVLTILLDRISSPRNTSHHTHFSLTSSDLYDMHSPLLHGCHKTPRRAPLITSDLYGMHSLLLHGCHKTHRRAPPIRRLFCFSSGSSLE